MMAQSDGAIVFVSRIYAPIFWLHDYTPLEKPIEWYVEVWDRLGR